MSLISEIFELKTNLVKMGSMVEKQVRDTYQAIKNKDKEELLNIISSDDEIDNMERYIESQALRILVTLSPRAKDFRIVTAVLKIITDLERIGDQTGDIAEICENINFDELDYPLPILEEMFKTTEQMLNNSMDSFVSGDLSIISGIDSLDDIVDDLYIKCREKIVEKIKIGEKPELQLDLMQIAKYMERIGDHAENIAEWVSYAESGIHPILKRGDI